MRGNFWPGLHFRDLEDLNNQALAWLNTTANPRVHGTTGEVPFSRLRAEGVQDASKALTYDTSVLTSRRRSKDCVISYEGNLYSVPAAYARKTHEAQNHGGGGAGDLLGSRGSPGPPPCSAWERRAQCAGGALPRTGNPYTACRESVDQSADERLADTSLFWDAPVVEVRPLAVYDQLLWEVSS